jgi:hypothetical protein
VTQANGFLGRRLNPMQVEVYLWLAHEGMTSVAEILATQDRAIEIVAAHEKVGAMLGRHL